MKGLFIGLGISFLVILIAGSALLFSARNSLEEEQIEIPALPEAPEEPGGTWVRLGASAAEMQAAATRDQAQATEYQAAVQKYEADLMAYNDALNRQQQAQQDYDNQRKSYLLYAIILIAILAALALVSFILAGVIGKPSSDKLVKEEEDS